MSGIKWRPTVGLNRIKNGERGQELCHKVLGYSAKMDMPLVVNIQHHLVLRT